MGRPLPAFKASTTRMLMQQPLVSNNHTFPPKTSPWYPYCCHMGLTAPDEGPEHLYSRTLIIVRLLDRPQTQGRDSQGPLRSNLQISQTQEKSRRSNNEITTRDEESGCFTLNLSTNQQ